MRWSELFRCLAVALLALAAPAAAAPGDEKPAQKSAAPATIGHAATAPATAATDPKPGASNAADLAPPDPANDPKPVSKHGKGKPVATPDGGESIGSLDRMLPVGKSADKVALPSFDTLGRLVSITEIDRITRIDTDHFALDHMIMNSFDPGKKDPKTGKPATTTMIISTGSFFIPTKTLTTEQPCTITKPEFDLKGSAMIWRAEDGVGIMQGPVEMIIHEQDQHTATPHEP